MPKTGKVKLTYHVKAGQNTEKAHTHINYSIGTNGKVSTARSTVHTSEKPGTTKGECPVNTQDNQGAEVWDWTEEVESNKEAVDQAYLEHIEETALDEKDKASRVRPKGVSHWISLFKAISGRNTYLFPGRITAAVGASV